MQIESSRPTSYAPLAPPPLRTRAVCAEACVTSSASTGSDRTWTFRISERQPPGRLIVWTFSIKHPTPTGSRDNQSTMCFLSVTGRHILLSLLCIAAACGERPNLLAILADDLGWYDTAIYNPLSPTPIIANLTRSGLRLDRTTRISRATRAECRPASLGTRCTGHYVFRYCSPTRRSFLTGRFPNHITTIQPDKALGNDG